MPAQIIDRGRGPEIAGTRITVYDIMDYAKHDWSPHSIASLFRLETEQVLAALRYIEDHKAEVTADYQEMLEFSARGNPPEIEAKLAQSRARVAAWMDERKRVNGTENHEGHSG